ncbi:MAG: flagellar protein FlaG [bacterium]|jgi:flagellar protein FlaG
MKVEAITARNSAFSGSRSTAAQENSAPALSPEERMSREVTPEFTREYLPVSERIVIEAIEKANRAIQGVRTQLEFSVHEKTGEIMVKVKNSDSGEVIREIPPEKILDLVANIWEMLGIIVDKKV